MSRGRGGNKLAYSAVCMSLLLAYRFRPAHFYIEFGENTLVIDCFLMDVTYIIQKIANVAIK